MSVEETSQLATICDDDGPDLTGGHWPDIAQRWSQVGLPLRPSKFDIDVCTETIHRWAHVYGAPRALILGVTPELCNLPWPPGSTVAAIDRTEGMIDALWPGPREAVICADWTDMPLEPNSSDIALCDGGLHLLAYPHEHIPLVSNLRRIVAVDGLCIFRMFVPPLHPERPESVLEELLTGKFTNPNVLKLRVGMALQDNSEQGVRLGDVWKAIHQAAPDLRLLAERLGQPPQPFLAINTYRDCPTRYHFLSVDEARAIFCGTGGFTLEMIQVPDYELGQRCPIIVLRRDSRN